jgi:hypothetical protein
MGTLLDVEDVGQDAAPGFRQARQREGARRTGGQLADRSFFPTGHANCASQA